MNDIWDLISDNDTVSGKAVSTLLILLVATFGGALIGRLAARRTDDRYRRYYTRKIVRYVLAFLALIAAGIVWRPFAGQLGLVIGLITAGLAFAMQELIGALAGWFNIVSGSIYRVGNRVEVGGVRGDVIDVTPLRTKVMEIGSSADDRAWIRGRQYTGRVVAISNKMTFTEPVYNYSAGFDFIWEEVMIPVAYDTDWKTAEVIMTEEAERISVSEDARAAIARMVEDYPIARTEIEPRVYVRSTDNYLELAARFVVPVRQARRSNDSFTRAVLARLADARIPVASATLDVTMRHRHPDAVVQPDPTETIASGRGT